MKQVKLLSLELTNFKGVKSFKLVVNGQNVKVYGDNAAGKTTLFDAFIWLLFDKDSQNKKDFDIKTLTNDGQVIHNLEHSVEAVLSIDGIQTSYKKVYKEKWTKKRGQAKADFTGHVTDHFVDDVPMAKKDYVTKVNEIIDEEVFKLITSPSYFNEQLKWQDRRKLLLEIAGDVSDQEVIQLNIDLAALTEFLTNKSVEDMKKIIASRKKHINDELEKIPVRIDEIVKMTPDSTIDVEALKAQVTKIEAEIDGLKTKKLNVQNGAAVLEKKKQLQEVEMQLVDLKRTFEADSKQEVYKAQARVQECQGNLQIVQSKLTQNQNLVQMKEREMNSLSGQINRLESEMARLRVEWSETTELQFAYVDNCECPSCKQPLPIDQVESARNEALAIFNRDKSLKLQQIDTKGNGLKTDKEKLLTIHNDLNNEVFHINMTIDSIKRDIEQKQKELAQAKQRLETAQNSVPDVTQSEEYKSIISQKQSLESEINQLQTHAYEAISGIDESINQLDQQKQSINSGIAQVANIETNKKRIAELETQQEQLATEYEKLEHQTFLIEEFIRTKVDMLNTRINSKFKYARFKMFDVQINGGLNETCETVIDGVPYTSLNNAARINCGIDICGTLQEHYGINVPLWVDNSESVTRLLDIDTQLIQLIVSEQDEQLRVEMA